MIINKNNPVIIDGGAHRGGAIKEFLSHYSVPIVYAFETVPELAAQIREKYKNNKNVEVVEKALCRSNEKISFNQLDYTGASSILNPTKEGFILHGEKMYTGKVLEVECNRLDEAIHEEEIDIVKLDLQGYELMALEGSEGNLHKTKPIMTEVEFIPLYER